MSRVEDNLDLLPAEKRALLAELLRKKAAKTTQAPLSFAQQRLWFLDQLDPGNASYNIARAVRLEGSLDLQALRRALNAIIARHESLRTNFISVEGEPVQVIAPSREIELHPVDLGEVPETERESEGRRLAAEAAVRGFNLADDHLFRASLFRLNKQDHVLLLVMHHIISDGWSKSILFRELSILYEAFCTSQPSPLSELSIQYADFARWQRETLQGETLEQQVEYWKQHLAGAPALLGLTTDKPRPKSETNAGSHCTILLPVELKKSLIDLSRREGVTLFMTLLAAFKTLLFRYTGQEDIVVGTTIAGRNRVEIESLIGFFVNTLALRTNISGDSTFRQMVQRVREVTLGAYAHQDLPFERIIEELQPDRNAGHTPIFQVMFDMQNAPREALSLHGLTVTHLTHIKETSKFDVTLYVTDTENGLACGFEYNTDLFERDTIRRMLGHFGTLLEGIVANPDARVSDLELLTEAEREQLQEWNQTATDYSGNECLHELFEAQAERTPRNIAVTLENEELTYEQLNARANQLAHYLRKRGIGPESLVGICIERSVELVIGLLGILKAGAAYVPLDPAYPEERLRLIVEESQTSIVLTDQRSRDQVRLDAVNSICLDTDWDAIVQESSDNPTTNTNPDNPAYVIYTSGSTGKPKGVAITHRAICNHMDWMQNRFPLSATDRVLQKTPISFDASVWEFYAPLLAGARLVMARPDGHQDSEYLVQAILQYGITTLQVVPTLLRLLLDEQRFTHCRSLTRVYCGGEPLPRELVQRFSSNYSATLTNLYGPTEATIDATYWTYEREQALHNVPIGRPIFNMQAYVLDKDLQRVPVGIPGELYIGGIGLARGYLNRADLTAERFIPNPFGDTGERIYQTGDLARYLADGNIEYLGRTDHQVKLRGFRIELGEIENVVNQYPQVREAIVVVREDEPDDQRIVVYVVPSKAGVDTNELRECLRQRLPGYMLPSAIVELKEFPLTPNGKVDRNALPAPQLSRSDLEAPFEGPRTPTEEVLASIWSEILKVDGIGVHDNFFHLGGHSLLAVRVVSRIRSAFAAELPLRSFFDSPTIAGCAKLIDKAMRDSDGPQMPPLVRASRREGLPLSFAQQRLWFLNELEGESALYNIPWAMRLRGELNVQALREALDTIIRRHEVLRTAFSLVEGQPVQIISDSTNLTFGITDLSELPDTLLQKEAETWGISEARQQFDLHKGPLLRARLLRMRTDDHVLCITTHHIVSDAWSAGIFVRELTELYDSFLSRREPRLPELPVQYADYAVWQRNWLEREVLDQQLRYWKERLLGIPPVLELPKDRPRPTVQTFLGATRSTQLSAELTKALNELSQREGVTLFMTLLAAFQVLLCRYSSQEDVVVGSPSAGRKQEEVEGLIGCFVNTLILRTDLSGNPSFRELLKRVREVALGAYANQEVPFEKLVNELQPERNLSYTPLFQVMFVLQNAPRAAFELSGLTITRTRVETRTSKFDLTIFATENAGELKLSFEYNTDIFDDARIDRMLEHFTMLLEGVVRKPETRIQALEILTSAERERLLVGCNQTAAEFTTKGIPELFEEQAERTPDETAVVFENRQITYRELNSRANQLARYLKDRGVGPEVLVGVCVQRSLEMVIALLGIMKAGGAYLPLDPVYPAERLRFMLDDANALLLLTQRSLLKVVSESRSQMICLDSDWPEVSKESEENLETKRSQENLAYVIYTSGSTGKPKGVAIEHRSVAALLSWASGVFSQEELRGVVASTSICFDLSVFELFVPLSCGGKVLLAENVLQLPTLAAAEDVTLINTVPSAMVELLRLSGLPKNVQTVNLAGEPLSSSLVKKIYEQPQIKRVFDLYGPSEDTTYSTFALRLPNGPKTIGRPVSNTRVYLLDSGLQPVPTGVPGELYLGGAGLARGYLHRPELTASAFVCDPFTSQKGARLYKTGDLARYLEDGNIEYLGRIDNQVKLRGFRIELGEIEAVLNSHPQVREAVVLAREDGPGNKQLIGYVAPDLDELEPELRRYFAAAHPDTAEAGQSGSDANGSLRAKAEQTLLASLREMLRQRLPEHMAPSDFVFLTTLPLTANGKVDRNALPAPDRSRSQAEAFRAPRNDLERQLAEIWAEVLRRDELGIDDNFFRLGGHSLLATQVVSRVRERFNIQFPLRRLFEFPTIAELAASIGQAQQEGAVDSEFQIRSKRRDTSTLLENIDNLSAEQIDSLLADVLGNVNQ